MSNLYNLEPQPTAKVILHTTAGDLSLELFGKQTPLASRNFLQHCLDGYYTNTIFHRLVPGFIIQGGDPTGTGSGGESALNNGTPFEDEFHSRLKFNRRGLLGMANDGPDSNGSQFFLTLGVTAELQGKHTLFGRIEGDTIYNLMKMGDAEMGEGEGSERPLYPTKITGAEVIVNPFEDLVARAREAPRVVEDAARKERKRKKPTGKNVLSFGGDEGEEDAAAPVLKKTKANPKLFGPGETLREKQVSVPKQKMKEPPVPQTTLDDDDEDEVKEVRRPSAEKPKVMSEDDSEEDEPLPNTSSRSKLEETNAEIAALKASMKRKFDPAPKETEKPKSLLESMIPSNSTRGRKRGKAADEKGAFDLFKAFKSRLDGIPSGREAEDQPDVEPTNGHDSEPTASGGAADEEAELCDLHFIANCQSCKSWEDKLDGEADADADDDNGTWMAHRLTFAKDTLGKDLEWKKKMEEIEVIDPREKARAIEEAQKKAKERKKR